ncbi:MULTISPECIES: tol-pal system YbgF family protein [Acetobacter]|nr:MULTISPECIES: hypothetical protein [Acetobacter]MCP1196426.1 hypothetical protein [Acetobacter senegalensis]GAL96546.1 hypothetical protein GOX1689 [Acetobacter tropicalis]GBR71096.1 hypothetical protein AA0312_2157 [Acetobacter tropicalis NRIC 0312]GEL49630.1 hypothetical protein ATR01nite_07050 [Acetobacter tropicalis]
MKRLVMTSVSACGRMAVLGLPLAAVLAASTPLAHAQEVSSREGLALQNQIMALQQQLSQIQSSGGSGALPAPSATPAPSSGGGGDLTAQLLERVNTLEQQQREMRGEIDQLTNDLQKQTAALSKQVADAQFAAQNGGGGAAAGAAAGAATAATASAASGSGTDAAAKPTTPDAMLAAGKAALQKRDYATAHENAEGALKNAKGSFKVDAQFLLAQSLAGEKQYRQSAVAYYDAYRQAPKSARAPDALLGVTASLLALGDKKAACQALGKLKSEFPSPTQRVSHAAEIYAGRGGCQ